MCDLQQCEQLIATHEAQVGQPFDFVTRIRLDVAWEAELPVPAALFQPSAEDEDVVHVPHMNGQGGTNDKFVFGARRAMAAYLNRTGYFWRNVSWYAWVARGKGSQPFAYDCARSPSSERLASGGRYGNASQRERTRSPPLTGGMACRPKGFVNTAASCPKKARAT